MCFPFDLPRSWFKRLKSGTRFERQLFDSRIRLPDAAPSTLLPVGFPFFDGKKLQAPEGHSSVTPLTCKTSVVTTAKQLPRSQLRRHLMSLTRLMRICLSQVQKVREKFKVFSNTKVLLATCQISDYITGISEITGWLNKYKYPRQAGRLELHKSKIQCQETLLDTGA